MWNWIVIIRLMILFTSRNQKIQNIINMITYECRALIPRYRSFKSDGRYSSLYSDILLWYRITTLLFCQKTWYVYDPIVSIMFSRVFTFEIRRHWRSVCSRYAFKFTRSVLFNVTFYPAHSVKDLFSWVVITNIYMHDSWCFAMTNSFLDPVDFASCILIVSSRLLHVYTIPYILRGQMLHLFFF